MIKQEKKRYVHQLFPLLTNPRPKNGEGLLLFNPDLHHAEITKTQQLKHSNFLMTPFQPLTSTIHLSPTFLASKPLTEQPA